MKKDIRWYNLTKDEILMMLDTRKSGLLDDEVTDRQKHYGENKIPTKKNFSLGKILQAQFKSLLIYILLAAAFISFILGDFIDSGVILLVVFINVVFGFLQEYRAQKILDKLEKTIITKSIVVRNDREEEINSENLVPGDIISLNEGDKIPADARLIDVKNFNVMESVLTGEAQAVEKTNETLRGELILPDQKNIVFMGTLVLTGQAIAVVVATGADTYLGKISLNISQIEREQTPLQTKIDQFSRHLVYLILASSAILFFWGINQGVSLIQMLLTAVAIAVSAIPEGLVVITTIILALGMKNILKQKAVVRRLIAAETLGSTTVICVDKTGTLTHGKMRLEKIITEGYQLDLAKGKSPAISQAGAQEILFILKIGALCNNANTNLKNADGNSPFIGDPIDQALLTAVQPFNFAKKELEKETPRLDEAPFNTHDKYMLTLHHYDRDYNIVYAKGAPEAILGMSRFSYVHKPGERGHQTHQAITLEKLDKINHDLNSLARQSLRVLAFAYQKIPIAVNALKNVKLEDFVFVGLMGFKDPLREDAISMIKAVRQAGMKPIIITGDYRVTARAVAHELGLTINDENILDGEDLEKMNESKLIEKIKNIKIFARVVPEQKLKIVKAWQELGEVVAMTGDGVNDAPALKKADIGIAFGSGTEAAKEAADIVLLDNNFSVIVKAIEEGRIILENIKRVILYLLSNAFAEVLIVSGSLLLGWPLPLIASQIIWINLINDTLPALSLTQEHPKSDLLQEKPFKKDAAIIDRKTIFLSAFISLVDALAVLLIFFVLSRLTGDLLYARTAAFAALGLISMLYIFSIKDITRRISLNDLTSNKLLLLSVAFGVCLQAIAVHNHFFQKIFETADLEFTTWLFIIMIAFITVVLTEVIKFVFNKIFLAKNFK